jgi:hypothetical protein
MGVSVSDTTAEMRIATASVMANSRKSRPTTSPMKRSGISTATRENVSEMMVKAICFDPLSAASSGSSPSSTYRAMFSITTMASSTTNPVAMVSAIRVKLFTLKPARYMTPKVPTIDSGTAAAGMRVAVALLRNTKITATTSPMASSSSNWVSCTEARMVTVRSVRSVVSIDAGSAAVSDGSSPFTRSTTSITLAPGWRWMLRMIAGVSFIHAASLAFSASSTTSAMSVRYIGAPFLYATTIWRYSSGLLSWSFASIV